MRRKVRRRRKPILVPILLLLAVIAGACCCLIPYMEAQSTMPADGILTIEEQKDGSFLLHWPKAVRTDYYQVEILNPPVGENDPEPVWVDRVKVGEQIFLPQLPTESEYIIRVNTVVEYSIFGKVLARIGDEPLTAVTVLRAPRIVEFQWDADTDKKVVSVTYEMMDADYAVFRHLSEDGTFTELERMKDSGQILLEFGENGDFPIPKYGEDCELAMSVFRQEAGLEFYGAADIRVRIDREDLLGRDLNLELVNEENNVFSLCWQETKGEYYQIQRYSWTGEWETVWEVYPGQELTYKTEHLKPFEDYTYRVVAVGGQTMEDSPYAAISQEMNFRTRESAVYATVWPVMDLTAYTGMDQTETAGIARTGKAYCVLGEENGFFQVQVDGELGYIDSNYCMINLPEYMGDLCSYEITNSYSSIYMVHNFAIPDVTGVVTGGYENILLADGTYAVPLLYPTAKKLVTAAESAIENGYRLKIYDAFRPNAATNEIYNLTSQVLTTELPEESVTGELASDYQKDEEPVTYQMMMTNGIYQLTHFLAKGVSRHNLGVALDLTLEDAYSRNEIPMQSAIHDLSWHSVTSRNNANAKTLASIMKGAGFATLSSEWWHFQDDDAKKAYNLPAVSRGVSMEGWIADDRGWMYRDNKGSTYKNETLAIDGVTYRFDGDGYLVTSE